ncbi:condensation domain-containing protein, partial [Paucibacter sp. XJ19-41]|uniref:condensation domain-containing protein n=1 Tax=Paucibacter sp. XJ19-41 TaxID=2927824 RepID=UPI00234BDADF
MRSDAAALDEAPGTILPLLPIQADFLELERPSPHHWNQALLLRCREPLDPVQLEQALQAVVSHHDALRLRYHRVDGNWQQTQDAAATSPMVWLREARDVGEIERVCQTAQRSLDLANGPLLRAVLIDVADGSSRLMLVAHHLVIDGVSWRILLEDLQTACRRLRDGAPVVLPAKTSPYGHWAARLQDLAQANDDEFGYWATLPEASVRLPCDAPQGSMALRHQVQADIRLDRVQTQALLKQVPAAYRTQINDLLLTALGRALCQWSGADRIRIDLEGHGREDLFDDIDLTRTVGWFTSLYPVVIEPLGAPGDAIQRVKETLRQVPRRGLSHGIFKHHGAPEQRQALAAMPRAQVLFNYLGQFDGSFDDQAWWVPASESVGACMDEDGPASHELSINGQVFDGELRLNLSHGEQRYSRAMIEALLQAFREELIGLIAHCVDGVAAQGGALGVTPSDVPLAGLDQAALNALSVPAHRLGDLYPLSPMQAGMLFHSLLDPQGSAYLNQVRMDLEAVDEAKLRDAWQAALQRHDVLRVGFLHDQIPPLQWVDRHSDLPMTVRDWRDQSGASLTESQANALDALAQDELNQGFDLREPPLMRLVLVRLPCSEGAVTRYHLVWTYHHLLLDGWSTSQLLAEVLRHYGGERVVGRPVHGWREHIAWLAGRDAEVARAFWQSTCTGLDTPTRLAASLPLARIGVGMGLHSSELDASRTARLIDFARRERVTLNTLVQAAWALLLKSRTGQLRVSFGATTSGRPADLPGIEQSLGLFINTLPMVVNCSPDQPVSQWLRCLQSFNLAAREHEHTPLNDIQRWAGHGGQGLFDSIVVFENYPVDEVLHQVTSSGLRCSAVSSREQTSYPMTVAVLQGDTLRLKYGHDLSVFDAGTVAGIAAQIEHILMQLSEQPDRRLGELPLLDSAARMRLALWERNESAHAISDEPVHRLIEIQAHRQPLAIALILGDDHLDYATLNHQANQLAHYLIARGIGPEDRVGVAMERSFELVSSLLAVLKTGAAYVPLDPSYPTERLAYMGEDSGMAVLLTQQRLQERLTVPGVPCVAVDALELSDHDVADPQLSVHGGQLAYVIYTSGSTGRPKGVAVPHGPLSMHCQVTADLYEMGPWSREFHFLSFAFDGAHERWLTALLCGASLVLRDETLWSAERTQAELQRHGVTNAGFPPVYLQQLAAEAENSGTAPPVSLYSFGGEAMPRASFEQVKRALHPRVLIN